MSDSDSDDNDFKDYANITTKTVVVIDTSESMFTPSPLQDGLSGFQVALKALHKVNDGLIFIKTTRNQVAALTFHENEANRVLMDFQTPFKEGLIKIKDLSETKLVELTDFKSTTKPNFAHFLIEVFKVFKQVQIKSVKQLFFITNNPDPCQGDVQAKFQALQEFKQMKDLKISFDLLFLNEDFDLQPFYEEAYETLEKSPPKFYYNITHLSSTITDSIKYKSMIKNLKIYPCINSTLHISCVVKKYPKHAKLLTDVHVTRDLKQEVKTVFVKKSEVKYKLLLGSETTLIDKEEHNRLLETDFEKGVTIIHATKENISIPGIFRSTPVLISAKESNNKQFIAFWEAAIQNNYKLIGMIKRLEYSRVLPVELTPIFANKERQFLMISLPLSTDIHHPKYQENRVVENKNIAIMEELVEKSTIKNYDITKVRPFKFVQQIKYFKKELIGQEYNGGTEYTDLLSDKVYDGDVSSIIEKLNEMYKVEDTGKGKRTKSQALKPPIKRSKV